MKYNIRNSLVFFIMLLGVSSCIEPFFAETDEEPDLISIEGGLLKGMQKQKVIVSRTTSIENPLLVSLRGCSVSVHDDMNEEFVYEEAIDGTYVLEIPTEDLIVGRQYMLRVITPEGKVYESDYETLHAAVPIDSFYYDVEDRTDAITGEEYNGVQFYLDVKALENDSRYFRWKLQETYEYSSFGPISFYYMDATHTPVVPEDIWRVYTCWRTNEIEGQFLSNTMKLNTNDKKNIKLNYVSARTEELRIKYSLLLSQYPISEGAYNYFELNKIATEESDGLYTRQPRQPLTNICNTEDGEERVLGYFWVSSRTAQRMFIPRITGLDVQADFCAVEEYNDEDHGDGPFPMYLYEDKSTGKLMTSSPYCFDCTRRGGTNVRPYFWE